MSIRSPGPTEVGAGGRVGSVAGVDGVGFDGVGFDGVTGALGFGAGALGLGVACALGRGDGAGVGVDGAALAVPGIRSAPDRPAVTTPIAAARSAATMRVPSAKVQPPRVSVVSFGACRKRHKESCAAYHSAGLTQYEIGVLNWDFVTCMTMR